MEKVIDDTITKVNSEDQKLSNMLRIAEEIMLQTGKDPDGDLYHIHGDVYYIDITDQTCTKVIQDIDGVICRIDYAACCDSELSKDAIELAESIGVPLELSKDSIKLDDSIDISFRLSKDAIELAESIGVPLELVREDYSRVVRCGNNR